MQGNGDTLGIVLNNHQPHLSYNSHSQTQNFLDQLGSTHILVICICLVLSWGLLFLGSMASWWRWSTTLWAFANESTILISEVYPAPSSTESEWIELVNLSSQPINLQGWWLEDVLAVPTIIYQVNPGEPSWLNSGQTIVFELASAKLNNSGDGVVIKNTQGEVVDTMTFSSTTSQLGWARVDFIDAWEENTPTKGTSMLYLLSTATPSPLPSSATTPTPSPTSSPFANPTPTSTASPLATPSPSPVLTGLQLSEVMYCPETGEPEWIEVFNTTAQPIDLSAWLVSDDSTNHRQLTGIAPAHGYVAINFSSSFLNNSGDSVYLKNADETILDHTTFPFCDQKNVSWARRNQDWLTTTTATPNAANVFTSLTNQATPYPSLSPGPSASLTPSASPKPSTTTIKSALTPLPGCDDQWCGINAVSPATSPSSSGIDPDVTTAFGLLPALSFSDRAALATFNLYPRLAITKPWFSAASGLTRISLPTTPPLAGTISVILGGVLVASGGMVEFLATHQKPFQYLRRLLSW